MYETRARGLNLNDCADQSFLQEIYLSLARYRPPSDLGMVHHDVKFDASAGACPTRYRPAINARRYIDVIPGTAVSRSPSLDMIKMYVHVDSTRATSLRLSTSTTNRDTIPKRLTLSRVCIYL